MCVTRVFWPTDPKACCPSRQLLDLNPVVPKLAQKSVRDLMLELTGIDITRCPLCQKGTLVLFANLPVPGPGFFVRIARRINTRVRARFSPSQRIGAPGSSFPSFLARSHFGGDRQLS